MTTIYGKRLAVILSLICALAMGRPAGAENWPRFRGPAGQGISSETDLPVSWSATQHVRWKTDIPGEGWSSPIVFDDHVFLTTATEEGVSCRAIAVDRTTGRVLWNVEVVRQAPRKKRRENSYASPTPVTDGERVFVVFGDGSIAALDYEGRILWTNRDVKFYSHHGLGASPILDRERLIMPFDSSSDGPDIKVGWKIPWRNAVVLALVKQTGEVAWTGRRGLSRLAHVTPVVLGEGKGRRIISNAGDVVQAFEPTTGRRLWSVYSQGEGVTPSMVIGDGLIFTASGFEEPTIRAIRPGGSGDVTRSHIAWEQKKGVPTLSSLLYVKGFLYTMTAEGVVTCFRGKSGEIVWQGRLGGKHWASPVYADGRIYFLDEEGTTRVIAPGTKFKLLAENRLNEHCQASPAVSQGNIFLRTARRLYCIGK